MAGYKEKELLKQSVKAERQVTGRSWDGEKFKCSRTKHLVEAVVTAKVFIDFQVISVSQC